ncbi:M81 family metallopeptidase [Candidatus Latescibacterota bacterium]
MNLKRVMIGGMMHETNTFNPFPCGLEKFKLKGLLFGDEIISGRRGSNTEIGGFIDSLESNGIEIVTSAFAEALPSGIVTAEAVDTVLNAMLDTIEKVQVDGILLSLHGAMVTENCDDGEGYILEKIREKAGPDIPVVITLDFHAVLTPRMVSNIDAVTIYRTYPHIDNAERGNEAGMIMNKILNGEINPVVRISKQPLLIGPPHNVLPHDMPMKKIMDRTRYLEHDNTRVIAACPAQGFTQQDVPFAGTGVAVTTDSDPELAQKEADELGRMMFECRHDFLVDLHDPQEAIMLAKKSKNPPVAIADSGDNIGAGTPGDGTALLREILRQNAPSAFVQLCDPEAAIKAAGAGIGSNITLAVGGKSDPVYGPPVKINGTVRTLSDGVYRNREWGGCQAGVTEDMGLSARIDCGGITVVVTTNPVSPNNIMHANSIGVYPEDYRIIVCKGGLAFRDAYKPPRVNSYIQCASPGFSSPDLNTFTFNKIIRPIFPLDGAEPLL